MTTRELEMLLLGVLIGMLLVVICDWWRERRRQREARAEQGEGA